MHEKHHLAGWVKLINKVRSQSSPRVQGILPPNFSISSAGEPQNTTTSGEPEPRCTFLCVEGPYRWEATGQVTGEVWEMQVSNRNQRSEAYSYVVTSGAVFGLIWKGQMSTEVSRQHAFPEEPGFGSSLAATQSVWVRKACAFCRYL